MNNNSLLIIFVKNPELGKVKTRLAATVGNEVALAVYFQLLKKTRDETGYLPVDKTVYYSHETEPDDLWYNEVYDKAVQEGQDLGERMKNAFTQAFRKGYEKVCIIGSDCMDISEDILQQAFDALDSKDVVIGPSEDGGYYLLGMHQMIPDFFENKAWSTDEVFVSTLDDIVNLNLSHSELPVLNDVDTEEDLGNWAAVMTKGYQAD